ncbi:hypothetical protein T265_11429 [Opisthorchis viverrini]|uniref:Reverse transcriptase domain-containing protein n=1 Tax=Opisthorchis viverrini TaxID=6198 RepID=A0A074Z9H9_OPIVI|nr:hypothetical protein T265_11429 [Opisthorchis viverrini]KER19905.1 hypothetical protein T265_11429 [Opisthorchis viverrini]
MLSRQVPYAFAPSVHVDRHSFESVYLSSWLNAQFHTDRCNYDHGWPPITSAHPNAPVNNGVNSSTNQILLDAEPSDANLDPTLMMCSLQHNKDVHSPFLFNFVIDEIMRRTLEDLENPGVEIVADESLVDLEYADDVTLIFEDQSEARALSNKLTTIILSFGMRLAPSKCKVMLQNVQSPNMSLTIQGESLEIVENFTYPGSSKDNRVTLRIETPSSDTFPGRPFALVRGTRQCDNLEVVCNQHTDVAAIAQCASAALAPGALTAELLSTKYVNQLLRMDILRLQSQYALDWDKEKRQLSLLSGLNGNVLAILSVRTDGNIALINVQYKPNDEQDNSKTVESANADFMTKLETFTPPPTNSLDEWISEVHDFCIALSGSLP